MKQIYWCALLMLITHSTFAQAPEMMSYQFIVRDPSGILVAEQIIGVQISVLQESENGTSIYEEFHNIMTNSNGAGSLSIGSGTVLFGSFGTIDWGGNAHFLKSEIDPEGGNNYSITGTTQMLSVPYALHAANGSRYRVGDLALGGIIFSVWRGADGQDHGLVASLENVGGNQFWSNQYEVTGSNSASNGSINQGASIAGAACEAYASSTGSTGITYDDWYLPAVWELTALSQSSLIINNILNDDGNDTTVGLNEDLDSGYWSSTEIGSSFAWFVQMASGQANTNFKDSLYRVRAIRRF